MGPNLRKKGIFVRNRKERTLPLTLHTGISQDTKFQLKQNLPKKGISSLKLKNRTFVSFRDCYLLFQTFPLANGLTQPHFNVFSPFSCKDN